MIERPDPLSLLRSSPIRRKARRRSAVSGGGGADFHPARRIDKGKALRKAIVQIFGAYALIQRCQEQKRRNIKEHLPEDMIACVKRAQKDAAMASEGELARIQPPGLAGSLQFKHPGEAASLREGLAEIVTVQDLDLTHAPYRTLRATKLIKI